MKRFGEDILTSEAASIYRDRKARAGVRGWAWYPCPCCFSIFAQEEAEGAVRLWGEWKIPLGRCKTAKGHYPNGRFLPHQKPGRSAKRGR